MRSQPEAVVRDVAASNALLEGGASSQATAIAKLKAAPFSFSHRHIAQSTQHTAAGSKENHTTSCFRKFLQL